LLKGLENVHNSIIIYPYTQSFVLLLSLIQHHSTLLPSNSMWVPQFFFSFSFHCFDFIITLSPLQKKSPMFYWLIASFIPVQSFLYDSPYFHYFDSLAIIMAGKNKNMFSLKNVLILYIGEPWTNKNPEPTRNSHSF
jgi:hypothetical protein